MFYDEALHGSWNLYSVKTRKILTYSNTIAAASNVIAVAIGSLVGVVSKNPDLVKRAVNYLDVGGIIVTIKRIITDRKFITDIKKEFIEKEWQKALDC